MPVYDLNDEKVGLVSQVQYPDESADEDVVADELYLQSNIDPVRRHLMRSGYIGIDPGWLHKNLYATVDQLETVSDEGVYLYVLRDRLIRL